MRRHLLDPAVCPHNTFEKATHEPSGVVFIVCCRCDSILGQSVGSPVPVEVMAADGDQLSTFGGVA